MEEEWDEELEEAPSLLRDAVPPPIPRKSSNALCVRIFCQGLVGSYVVLIGTRLDRQGREQTTLLVWNIASLCSTNISMKLKAKDALISFEIANERFFRLGLSQTCDATEPGQLLKVVSPCPSGVHCWHISCFDSSARVVDHYALEMTHPGSTFEWSSDGQCVFSAQRHRLIIWTDQLGRIGELSYPPGLSSNDANATRICRLIYIEQPKEMIVAAFDNGTIVAWYLASGSIALWQSITSSSPLEGSSGVPMQRSDPVTDMLVSAPQQLGGGAGSGSHIARQRKNMFPRVSVAGCESKLTAVLCFQSGRVKRVELQLAADVDENTVVPAASSIVATGHVIEVNSLDLAREMRYASDSASASASAAAIAVRREQAFQVLSISALHSRASAGGTAAMSEVVGYMLLLGEHILVLNQSLMVLDQVSTGFKGSVSSGCLLCTPSLHSTSSSSTSEEVSLRCVAVNMVSQTANAVHCPLSSFLRTSSSSSSSELQTLRQRVCGNNVTTSSSAASGWSGLQSTDDNDNNDDENSSSQVCTIDDVLDFFASLEDLEQYAATTSTSSSNTPSNTTANTTNTNTNTNPNTNTSTVKRSSKAPLRLLSPRTPSSTSATAAMTGTSSAGTASLGRGGWEQPRRDKLSGRPVDLPVTFTTRIRSSGYGQTPPPKPPPRPRPRNTDSGKRSLSAPRGGASSSSSRNTSSSSSVSASSSAGRLRLYPMQCNPMTQHLRVWDYPSSSSTSSSSEGVQHGGAVFSLCFSSDASKLGVAAQNSAVTVLKLPRTVNRDESVYLGHNHAVRSVQFSSHRLPQHLVLACGDDRTARLWKHGKGDCAEVVFDRVKRSSSDTISSGTMGGMGMNSASAKIAATTATGSGGSNVMYSDVIRHAQFFYQDRFVLLTHKASLCLYNYSIDHLDDYFASTSTTATNSSKVKSSSGKVHRALSASSVTAANNDLTRFLPTGSYQLAHAWQLAGSTATQVTACAAMNTVQSPLILCATSDRSIRVLDAHTGSILREVAQAHDKAVSCLAVSQPSTHVQAGREQHQCFVSSALDNALCLWDLRQTRCVLRYTSHVQRREQLQAALSPCLRYLATGSEDRTARLFDIRAGREAAVLSGHRDVVSAVAFNPLFAQLATGSYDGTVRFYHDADCALYTSS